jgi:glycosyltransferase involved in cell wall biosynthesis
MEDALAEMKLDGPPPGSRRTGDLLLSIVVPVYDEESVIEAFHARLAAVLGSGSVPPAEILYVNDGSRDRSLAVLERLSSQDPRVAIVDLSRNFGKEIAMSAGLDHARGDAVIIIDADLQDPPELIPELVAPWLEGYDMVYARRSARQGEPLLKKATAYAFYRLMNRLAGVEIPRDTGDFRLLSRRALDALKQMREQHRFMKGLFAWVGFPQKEVLYRREPRHSGKTKWNYWRLWNFALEGITSFTIAPLKIASYLGFLTAFGAFVYAAWVILKKVLYGEEVPGYPSLMVVILFLGGVQLMTLGVIGEYLGRIFNETKKRPLYFLKGYTPARLEGAASSAPPRFAGEAQPVIDAGGDEAPPSTR